MEWVTIDTDCDKDTLLIQVIPTGPTCHTGTDTCWGGDNKASYGYLSELEKTITQRIQNKSEKSYVSSLIQKGISKVAQKVGEEATEVVIEAMINDNEKDFLNESADLLFHYLILLQSKGYKLEDVVEILEGRKK